VRPYRFVVEAIARPFASQRRKGRPHALEAGCVAGFSGTGARAEQLRSATIGYFHCVDLFIRISLSAEVLS
jgi:hypothetical protein